MKLSKPVLIGVLLLGLGAIAGWTLRPATEGDPSVPLPEYGGTVDYGFNAEVTWHSETKIEGENFVMHETTWKCVFHNRSDAPIQFSIPGQKLHLDHSIFSSQFIELPDSMLVDPPITIAAGEKKEFSARSGGMAWDKAKNGEFGFRIVAKIDDTFHILGCAANVREAPKAEQVAAGQPATTPRVGD
jgi:hypothetical protein